MQPEDLEPTELDQWLRVLRPRPVKPSKSGSAFQSLLLGTLESSQVVVMRAEDCGFSQWPDPRAVAAIVQSVQSEFRIAGGFLFGGTKEQGAYYKARLVVSQAPSENTTIQAPESLSQRGDEFQQAWFALRDRRPQIFAQINTVPIWKTASSDLDSLETLRFAAADPDKFDVQAALNYLRRASQIREQVARVFVSALLEAVPLRRFVLDAAETTEVLGKAMDLRLSLSKDIWPFLDFDAAVEFLTRRGFPQNHYDWYFPRPLLKTVVDRLGQQSASTNVGRAEAALSLVPLAGDAITDGSEMKAAVQELVEGYLGRSLQQGEPLVAWHRALQRLPDLEPLRSALVQAAEHRRIERRLPSWRSDALLFAPHEMLAHHDLVGFATAALDSSDPEVMQFLEGLSAAPYRRLLQAPMKREIAFRCVGIRPSSSWRDYFCLVRLFEGRDCAPLGEPSDDRNLLQDELRELFAIGLETSTLAPRLVDLLEFVGPLSPAHMTALAGRRPRFERLDDIEPWLIGWRGLDREMFERELLRAFAVAADVRESFQDSLNDISTDALLDFLLEPATNGVPALSERLRALTYFLGSPNRRVKLAESFSSALFTPEGQAFARDLLSELPEQGYQLLDELLPLTPEAEKTIGRILMWTPSGAHAARLAAQLCSRITRPKSTALDRVMFRALESGDFAQLKERVVRSCFRGSVARYRSAVARILDS